MRYLTLGSSCIEASVVGLGAWAIGGWNWGGTDEAESIRAVHAAIDAGINLIDTAPAYGFGRSEKFIGKAIKDRRDKVVLATKCGVVWHVEKGEHFFTAKEKQPGKDATKREFYRYLAPESIRYEVERSLKYLQTDYIDLYQTHWQDSTTPIGDTMGELLALKKEGKIRAIGVSNVTTDHLDEYRKIGAVDSDQERYSMLDREHETDLLPYCADNKIAFLAYSPLAQGLLTGKVGPDRKFKEGDQRNDKPRFSIENRKKVARMLEAFKPIADKHDISLGQLAIVWTLHQRGCSHALVGARNHGQAIENAVAGDIELENDEITAINRIIQECAADIP